MILIVSDNIKLREDLVSELKKTLCPARAISATSLKNPQAFYDTELRALIIDHNTQNFPKKALEDILNSMAKRIPVIICEHTMDDFNPEEGFEELHRNFSDEITILVNPTERDVLATLQACGITQQNFSKKWSKNLPFYNPQIPMRMLRMNQGICVLTIDASAFRKIEIEYGADVYEKTKTVFQSMLTELWGHEGCFRATDVLCRRAMHGSVYYVFLNRARHQGGLPRPGVLEKITDRITHRLQNALWKEIFKYGKDRRIPDCINTAPEISVGFSAAMNNPCLDAGEIVDRVIESSMNIAKVQLRKVQNLHRELMHTLIQDDHLTYSHFQGIFHMKNISKEMMEEVTVTRSFAPIAGELYGFESLIRVRTDLLETHLEKDQVVVESQYLRPDVLFSLAKATKTSLELDQACLRSAAEHCKGLPGTLMVNILPRNLYFIESLKAIFEGRERLIFEVSESEAISNFELMGQVRDFLRKENIGIAADDFGRGYAGLERVIKIEPDIIKFDRSLISNIHEDPIKHAYVSGLVKAAKMLNTIVLAEGIEKWEEAEVLKELGIELAQGFLFHKPQTKDHIQLQLDEAKSRKMKVTKLNTVA